MKISLKSQAAEEVKKRKQAGIQAIKSVMCSLKLNELDMLSLIVGYAARKQCLYASQITLGKWFGCDERTIRRVIAVLRNNGLINVYRKYPETNVYTIPEFFYCAEIQKVLKQWLEPIGKLFTKSVLILKNFLYNYVSDNNINLEKRADFSIEKIKAPTKEELKAGSSLLLEYWKSQEEKLGIPVPNVWKKPIFAHRLLCRHP